MFKAGALRCLVARVTAYDLVVFINQQRRGEPKSLDVFLEKRELLLRMLLSVFGIRLKPLDRNDFDAIGPYTGIKFDLRTWRIRLLEPRLFDGNRIVYVENRFRRFGGKLQIYWHDSPLSSGCLSTHRRADATAG